MQARQTPIAVMATGTSGPPPAMLLAQMPLPSNPRHCADNVLRLSPVPYRITLRLWTRCSRSTRSEGTAFSGASLRKSGHAVAGSSDSFSRFAHVLVC